MRYLWESAAFDDALATRSFWRSTSNAPDLPAPLRGRQKTDVAIIGAGFTGLNAALHLARQGRDILLLDARSPYWGATGRNGGFCCLGGAKASDAALRKLGGAAGPRDWRRTEMAAVHYVDDLLAQLDADVDRHSQGETILAHTPRAFARLRRTADGLGRDYGVTAQLTPFEDMETQGFGGRFYGALTLPIGFGLNPQKYAQALLGMALAAGAGLSPFTEITEIAGQDGDFTLIGAQVQIQARQVILATNGYSAETLLPELTNRLLPVQSSVIVTRPLTAGEAAAQGWHSDQMAYDTRALLHYFRRLPDGRFLFGMRGGLSARAGEQRAVSARLRRNFTALFPAWRDVDISHEWSGLACLTRNLVPFIGALRPGLYAGLGYHGNGVAMGSYAGALLAQQISGQDLGLFHPALCQRPMRRFAMGRARRIAMRAVYAGLGIVDRV